jgi:hypothetical protein
MWMNALLAFFVLCPQHSQWLASCSISSYQVNPCKKLMFIEHFSEVWYLCGLFSEFSSGKKYVSLEQLARVDFI